MNRVVLLGRLATEVELKTTQSGLEVAQFRLAVNRRAANKEGVREADFIPIVVWRQLAGLCHKYLSKGRQCAVIGTLQTRSYDAQDGSKRYVTEVIADEVEFIGSGEKGADTGAQKPTAQENAQDGFAETDEELPF